MARVIIVEDEYYPRQTLREKLECNFPDMEILTECENAEDALISILRLRPDLLFLDIQMPNKNGLWLADELLLMQGETFTPPDIVFTTGYAYPEYLLKAFELAAIDYLVKPVSAESLRKAVARYHERAGASTGLQRLTEALHEEKLLKFKSYNGLFLLRPEDIAYVEADRDYACMFLANGSKEDVFERLGEIEKKLPADTFLRTGKSVIVNRKYIRKITNTTLQLATPSTSYLVEISRSAIKQLKDTLI
ncbi:LytR/AlgR family response regulator transcription factor [Bacteroides sp. UBA939]|uniref:LytR/AlgR family response regulator transcription factor n=1 Tax=Bacteroides sp. UBA939 TaxID=1946092 RepID=UPI0025BEA123|nr:LytTR family DNA-binding domain-containing protein [Bacteroides sp. UBA939]